jgi:hypothetical protein
MLHHSSNRLLLAQLYLIARRMLSSGVKIKWEASLFRHLFVLSFLIAFHSRTNGIVSLFACYLL